MADETYKQAGEEFDETPPFDSDELDYDADADQEFDGGEDEEDEGVD